MRRIVSVSAAPYDGHEPAAALDSLARCGASHVEPAFIVGYTEPFDEAAFSDGQARRYAGWLQASGIACHAVSSHIDLGATDAARVFRGRMEFARRIGAAVINTNAAILANRDGFFRHIDILARQAEDLDLTICLENPGDARPGLLDSAADAPALLAQVGSPRVRLNYDPGNTASHRPELDAVADAIDALPACGHLHLKAVGATPEGWHFPPLGGGDLDYRPLLEALAAWPTLAVSLEMPLRMRRGPDAQPWRRVQRLGLDAIERCVRASLGFLASRLDA